MASNCPKPKRDGAKDEQRSITPYPRSRNSSGEKGGANQGSDTYRMINGFWGKELMVEKKTSKLDKEDEEEGEKKDNKEKGKEEENQERERKDLEAELRTFEQDWRK